MYLATTGRRTDAPSRPAGTGRRVPGTVVALGAVSLVTDVSSEMVTAVLPLYLVLGLGLSPLQFGFLDGMFNGATALVRLLGGRLADRGGGRHRTVAGAGYLLSALSRLGLLLAGGAAGGIAAALAADRLGKGVRTAPRDALITLSAPPDALGRAFGVHRAMDTTGALLGPLVAFAVLWATADAYDAVFVVSFATGLFGVLVLVLFVPPAPVLPAPVLPAPVPPGPVLPGPAPAVRAESAVRPAPAAGRVPAPRPAGRPRSRALADPVFRRVVTAAALLGAATIGDSFLYLLLQRGLDLAPLLFPLLPLGAAAGYLLLAVPAGRLADRIGRRLPFLCGHGALLAAYLTLLAPPGWPVAVLVLVLLGLFYAATDGVLMALAGPVLPRDGRAGGLAVLQTGQALARLAGAAGFGAAWTWWGPRPALAAAALALAAALVAAWRILPEGEFS
ncbi:MFS transporter [Kitasatospora sp. A2-31]|uniref:MFS transporter n=1 Tax=Kitasatospora sp. A2-31 TaxID=2916414 RepID=UPI001EEAE759|nr:MFS transporter [Kitasatospora sp. A2-31]MCG6493799.1 MFS transporter [Kitasatospora sp. A2-31]